MANELTRISPEGFDIANAYLTYGSVKDTAEQLQIPEYEVVRVIQSREVKSYLDGVYLDLGYRNRGKLGGLLDRIIDSKVEEAEESGEWTKKDIIDLLTLAHKMRMDELKLEKEKAERSNNTTTNNTVQVASFGDGSYGKLMERLLGNK